MKRLPLALAFLLCVVAIAPTFVQSPNYDVGPIWRVTDYHVQLGMGDAFWKDFHDHLKPLLEEHKKAGLIAAYKAFTNATTDLTHGGPVGKENAKGHVPIMRAIAVTKSVSFFSTTG
jgi:hypothetical protein